MALHTLPSLRVSVTLANHKLNIFDPIGCDFRPVCVSFKANTFSLACKAVNISNEIVSWQFRIQNILKCCNKINSLISKHWTNMKLHSFRPRDILKMDLYWSWKPIEDEKKAIGTNISEQILNCLVFICEWTLVPLLATGHFNWFCDWSLQIQRVAAILLALICSFRWSELYGQFTQS